MPMRSYLSPLLRTAISLMRFNIAFYVHHHGSGHVMRSLAIAAHLDHGEVTFLGSDLERYQSIIPERVRCIHLPMDTSAADDHYYAQRDVAGLHHAPLNVAGQAARVAILSKYFSENRPLLLVVDVSVEVAMLATLCGVPTVIVRQHGTRNDLPHVLAYQNAIGLLAPYGYNLQQEEEDWLSKKTYFSGGFSRFNAQVDVTDRNSRQVGVLVGNGGTSIDERFLTTLLSQCAGWHFHVVGEIEGIDHSTSNVTVYGHVANPLAILSQCGIVIGNAGHNTVMEMASLNKRMIVIPESRPFDEQVIKAQVLGKLHLAKVILPELLFTTDWAKELNQMMLTTANWGATISETAANDAAGYLKQAFSQQYQ